ncbi:MAG: hypothetical protein Q7K40_04950 [bacterium]|nr:hypothetical protein [bacterium]
MNTITIPRNLIKNDDLVIIPRLEYQGLLKYKVIDKEHEYLWQDASKDKFFKSYHKSDAIYDQI